MSTTVTVKPSCCPLLPEPSVAVQVTVVVPTGKVFPRAATHDGDRFPLTVSFALAVNVTYAPPGPVAGTLIDPGTVTTGGVVSSHRHRERVAAGVSVTVRRRARHRRCPERERVPDAGEQIGVKFPSDRSVADAPGNRDDAAARSRSGATTSSGHRHDGRRRAPDHLDGEIRDR